MGLAIKSGKAFILAKTDDEMQSLGIRYEIVAKHGHDGGPCCVALFYDKDIADCIYEILESIKRISGAEPTWLK